MSFNIEVRKKQLQSLDQYINSSRNRVLSLLKQFGWNPKEVLKKPDHMACPINSRHKIPVSNVDKHVEQCCLKSSGYDINEQFLPPPNPSASSISLDNAKKIEVLNAVRSVKPTFRAAWNGIEPDPLTVDRMFTTYSTDERLALYDYCVQNTEPPPTPTEFLIAEEKSENTKDLTPEEKLEKERNAKRRRIKYKSVHTGRNKSYTEVMREVINNQMEVYQEFVTSTQVQPTDTSTSYVKNGHDAYQSYPEVSYVPEGEVKHEKSISDRLSSMDGSYGHYSEKDDGSEKGSREKSYRKERSRGRREERSRERHRSSRRSKDRDRGRERHHSRSHHSNGNDRYHDSRRRSDRDRRR